MTLPPDSTLKEYLVLFVMQLSVGVILLNELPPRKAIQRMQTLALATSDSIKEKMETANDTEQKAMVIVSRDNLRRVMDTLRAQPFPITAMKARREWLDSVQQLLKNTEGYIK